MGEWVREKDGSTNENVAFTREARSYTLANYTNACTQRTRTQIVQYVYTYILCPLVIVLV